MRSARIGAFFITFALATLLGFLIFPSPLQPVRADTDILCDSTKNGVPVKYDKACGTSEQKDGKTIWYGGKGCPCKIGGTSGTCGGANDCNLKDDAKKDPNVKPAENPAPAEKCGGTDQPKCPEQSDESKQKLQETPKAEPVSETNPAPPTTDNSKNVPPATPINQTKPATMEELLNQSRSPLFDTRTWNSGDSIIGNLNKPVEGGDFKQGDPAWDTAWSNILDTPGEFPTPPSGELPVSDSPFAPAQLSTDGSTFFPSDPPSTGSVDPSPNYGTPGYWEGVSNSIDNYVQNANQIAGQYDNPWNPVSNELKSWPEGGSAPPAENVGANWQSPGQQGAPTPGEGTAPTPTQEGQQPFEVSPGTPGDSGLKPEVPGPDSTGLLTRGFLDNDFPVVTPENPTPEKPSEDAAFGAASEDSQEIADACAKGWFYCFSKKLEKNIAFYGIDPKDILLGYNPHAPTEGFKPADDLGWAKGSIAPWPDEQGTGISEADVPLDVFGGSGPDISPFAPNTPALGEEIPLLETGSYTNPAGSGTRVASADPNFDPGSALEDPKTLGVTPEREGTGNIKLGDDLARGDVDIRSVDSPDTRTPQEIEDCILAGDCDKNRYPRQSLEEAPGGQQYAGPQPTGEPSVEQNTFDERFNAVNDNPTTPESDPDFDNALKAGGGQNDGTVTETKPLEEPAATFDERFGALEPQIPAATFNERFGNFPPASESPDSVPDRFGGLDDSVKPLISNYLAGEDSWAQAMTDISPERPASVGERFGGLSDSPSGPQIGYTPGESAAFSALAENTPIPASFDERFGAATEAPLAEGPASFDQRFGAVNENPAVSNDALREALGSPFNKTEFFGASAPAEEYGPPLSAKGPGPSDERVIDAANSAAAFSRECSTGYGPKCEALRNAHNEKYGDFYPISKRDALTWGEDQLAQYQKNNDPRMKSLLALTRQYAQGEQYNVDPRDLAARNLSAAGTKSGTLTDAQKSEEQRKIDETLKNWQDSIDGKQDPADKFAALKKAEGDAASAIRESLEKNRAVCGYNRCFFDDAKSMANAQKEMAQPLRDYNAASKLENQLRQQLAESARQNALTQMGAQKDNASLARFAADQANKANSTISNILKDAPLDPYNNSPILTPQQEVDFAKAREDLKAYGGVAPAAAIAAQEEAVAKYAKQYEEQVKAQAELAKSVGVYPDNLVRSDGSVEYRNCFDNAGCVSYGSQALRDVVFGKSAETAALKNETQPREEAIAILDAKLDKPWYQSLPFFYRTDMSAAQEEALKQERAKYQDDLNGINQAIANNENFLRGINTMPSDQAQKVADVIKTDPNSGEAKLLYSYVMQRGAQEANIANEKTILDQPYKSTAEQRAAEADLYGIQTEDDRKRLASVSIGQSTENIGTLDNRINQVLGPSENRSVEVSKAIAVLGANAQSLGDLWAHRLDEHAGAIWGAYFKEKLTYTAPAGSGAAGWVTDQVLNMPRGAMGLFGAQTTSELVSNTTQSWGARAWQIGNDGLQAFGPVGLGANTAGLRTLGMASRLAELDRAAASAFSGVATGPVVSTGWLGRGLTRLPVAGDVDVVSGALSSSPILSTANIKVNSILSSGNIPGDVATVGGKLDDLLKNSSTRLPAYINETPLPSTPFTSQLRALGVDYSAGQRGLNAALSAEERAVMASRYPEVLTQVRTSVDEVTNSYISAASRGGSPLSRADEVALRIQSGAIVDKYAAGLPLTPSESRLLDAALASKPVEISREALENIGKSYRALGASAISPAEEAATRAAWQSVAPVRPLAFSDDGARVVNQMSKAELAAAIRQYESALPDLVASGRVTNATLANRQFTEAITEQLTGHNLTYGQKLGGSGVSSGGVVELKVGAGKTDIAFMDVLNNRLNRGAGANFELLASGDDLIKFQGAFGEVLDGAGIKMVRIGRDMEPVDFLKATDEPGAVILMEPETKGGLVTKALGPENAALADRLSQTRKILADEVQNFNDPTSIILSKNAKPIDPALGEQLGVRQFLDDAVGKNQIAKLEGSGINGRVTQADLKNASFVDDFMRSKQPMFIAEQDIGGRLASVTLNDAAKNWLKTGGRAYSERMATEALRVSQLEARQPNSFASVLREGTEDSHKIVPTNSQGVAMENRIFSDPVTSLAAAWKVDREGMYKLVDTSKTFAETPFFNLFKYNQEAVAGGMSGTVRGTQRLIESGLPANRTFYLSSTPLNPSQYKVAASRGEVLAGARDTVLSQPARSPSSVAERAARTDAYIITDDPLKVSQYADDIAKEVVPKGYRVLEVQPDGVPRLVGADGSRTTLNADINTYAKAANESVPTVWVVGKNGGVGVDLQVNSRLFVDGPLTTEELEQALGRGARNRALELGGGNWTSQRFVLEDMPFTTQQISAAVSPEYFGSMRSALVSKSGPEGLGVRLIDKELAARNGGPALTPNERVALSAEITDASRISGVVDTRAHQALDAVSINNRLKAIIDLPDGAITNAERDFVRSLYEAKLSQPLSEIDRSFNPVSTLASAEEHFNAMMRTTLRDSNDWLAQLERGLPVQTRSPALRNAISTWKADNALAAITPYSEIKPISQGTFVFSKSPLEAMGIVKGQLADQIIPPLQSARPTSVTLLTNGFDRMVGDAASGKVVLTQERVASEFGNARALVRGEDGSIAAALRASGERILPALAFASAASAAEASGVVNDTLARYREAQTQGEDSLALLQRGQADPTTAVGNIQGSLKWFSDNGFSAPASLAKLSVPSGVVATENASYEADAIVASANRDVTAGSVENPNVSLGYLTTVWNPIVFGASAATASYIPVNSNALPVAQAAGAETGLPTSVWRPSYTTGNIASGVGGGNVVVNPDGSVTVRDTFSPDARAAIDAAPQVNIIEPTAESDANRALDDLERTLEDLDRARETAVQSGLTSEEKASSEAAIEAFRSDVQEQLKKLDELNQRIANRETNETSLFEKSIELLIEYYKALGPASEAIPEIVTNENDAYGDVVQRIRLVLSVPEMKLIANKYDESRSFVYDNKTPEGIEARRVYAREVEDFVDSIGKIVKEKYGISYEFAAPDSGATSDSLPEDVKLSVVNRDAQDYPIFRRNNVGEVYAKYSAVDDTIYLHEALINDPKALLYELEVQTSNALSQILFQRPLLAESDDLSSQSVQGQQESEPIFESVAGGPEPLELQLGSQIQGTGPSSVGAAQVQEGTANTGSVQPVTISQLESAQLNLQMAAFIHSLQNGVPAGLNFADVRGSLRNVDTATRNAITQAVTGTNIDDPSANALRRYMESLKDASNARAITDFTYWQIANQQKDQAKIVSALRSIYETDMGNTVPEAGYDGIQRAVAVQVFNPRTQLNSFADIFSPAAWKWFFQPVISGWNSMQSGTLGQRVRNFFFSSRIADELVNLAGAVEKEEAEDILDTEYASPVQILKDLLLSPVREISPARLLSAIMIAIRVMPTPEVFNSAIDFADNVFNPPQIIEVNPVQKASKGSVIGYLINNVFTIRANAADAQDRKALAQLSLQATYEEGTQKLIDAFRTSAVTQYSPELLSFLNFWNKVKPTIAEQASVFPVEPVVTHEVSPQSSTDPYREMLVSRMTQGERIAALTSARVRLNSRIENLFKAADLPFKKMDVYYYGSTNAPTVQKKYGLNENSMELVRKGAIFSVGSDYPVFFGANELQALTKHWPQFSGESLEFVLGHEFAHNYLNLLAKSGISDPAMYRNELMADYVAGLFAQGIIDPVDAYYLAGSLGQDIRYIRLGNTLSDAIQKAKEDSHPAARSRSEAFLKGYNEPNPAAALAKFVRDPLSVLPEANSYTNNSDILGNDYRARGSDISDPSNSQRIDSNTAQLYRDTMTEHGTNPSAESALPDAAVFSAPPVQSTPAGSDTSAVTPASRDPQNTGSLALDESPFTPGSMADSPQGQTSQSSGGASALSPSSMADQGTIGTPQTTPTPAPTPRAQSSLMSTVEPWQKITSSTFKVGGGGIEGGRLGAFTNKDMVQEIDVATLDGDIIPPLSVIQVCGPGGVCQVYRAASKGYWPPRALDIPRTMAATIGCPVNGLCTVSVRVLARQPGMNARSDYYDFSGKERIAAANRSLALALQYRDALSTKIADYPAAKELLDKQTATASTGKSIVKKVVETVKSTFASLKEIPSSVNNPRRDAINGVIRNPNLNSNEEKATAITTLGNQKYQVSWTAIAMDLSLAGLTDTKQYKIVLENAAKEIAKIDDAPTSKQVKKAQQLVDKLVQDAKTPSKVPYQNVNNLLKGGDAIGVTKEALPPLMQGKQIEVRPYTEGPTNRFVSKVYDKANQKELGTIVALNVQPLLSAKEVQQKADLIKKIIPNGSDVRLGFVVRDPQNPNRVIQIDTKEVLQIENALQTNGAPIPSGIITRHYAFEREPKADGSPDYNARHVEAWKKLLAAAEPVSPGSNRYVFKEGVNVGELMGTILDAETTAKRYLVEDQNTISRDLLKILIVKAWIQGQPDIGYMLATEEQGHKLHRDGAHADMNLTNRLVSMIRNWFLGKNAENAVNEAMAVDIYAFGLAAEALDHTGKLFLGQYPPPSFHFGFSRTGGSQNMAVNWGDEYARGRGFVNVFGMLGGINKKGTQAAASFNWDAYTQLRDASGIYRPSADGSPRYVYVGNDGLIGKPFTLPMQVALNELSVTGGVLSPEALAVAQKARELLSSVEDIFRGFQANVEVGEQQQALQRQFDERYAKIAELKRLANEIDAVEKEAQKQAEYEAQAKEIAYLSGLLNDWIRDADERQAQKEARRIQAQADAERAWMVAEEKYLQEVEAKRIAAQQEAQRNAERIARMEEFGQLVQNFDASLARAIHDVSVDADRALDIVRTESERTDFHERFTKSLEGIVDSAAAVAQWQQQDEAKAAADREAAQQELARIKAEEARIQEAEELRREAEGRRLQALQEVSDEAKGALEKVRTQAEITAFNKSFTESLESVADAAGAIASWQEDQADAERWIALQKVMNDGMSAINAIQDEAQRTALLESVVQSLEGMVGAVDALNTWQQQEQARVEADRAAMEAELQRNDARLARTHELAQLVLRYEGARLQALQELQDRATEELRVITDETQRTNFMEGVTLSLEKIVAAADSIATWQQQDEASVLAEREAQRQKNIDTDLQRFATNLLQAHMNRFSSGYTGTLGSLTPSEAHEIFANVPLGTPGVFERPATEETERSSIEYLNQMRNNMSLAGDLLQQATDISTRVRERFEQLLAEGSTIPSVEQMRELLHIAREDVLAQQRALGEAEKLQGYIAGDLLAPLDRVTLDLYEGQQTAQRKSREQIRAEVSERITELRRALEEDAKLSRAEAQTVAQTVADRIQRHIAGTITPTIEDIRVLLEDLVAAERSIGLAKISQDDLIFEMYALEIGARRTVGATVPKELADAEAQGQTVKTEVQPQVDTTLGSSLSAGPFIVARIPGLWGDTWQGQPVAEWRIIISPNMGTLHQVITDDGKVHLDLSHSSARLMPVVRGPDLAPAAQVPVEQSAPEAAKPLPAIELPELQVPTESAPAPLSFTERIRVLIDNIINELGPRTEVPSFTQEDEIAQKLNAYQAKIDEINAAIPVRRQINAINKEVDTSQKQKETNRAKVESVTEKNKDRLTQPSNPNALKEIGVITDDLQKAKAEITRKAGIAAKGQASGGDIGIADFLFNPAKVTASLDKGQIAIRSGISATQAAGKITTLIDTLLSKDYVLQNQDRATLVQFRNQYETARQDLLQKLTNANKLLAFDHNYLWSNLSRLMGLSSAQSSLKAAGDLLEKNGKALAGPLQKVLGDALAKAAKPPGLLPADQKIVDELLSENTKLSARIEKLLSDPVLQYSPQVDMNGYATIESENPGARPVNPVAFSNLSGLKAEMLALKSRGTALDKQIDETSDLNPAKFGYGMELADILVTLSGKMKELLASGAIDSDLASAMIDLSKVRNFDSFAGQEYASKLGVKVSGKQMSVADAVKLYAERQKEVAGILNAGLTEVVKKSDTLKSEGDFLRDVLTALDVPITNIVDVAITKAGALTDPQVRPNVASTQGELQAALSSMQRQFAELKETERGPVVTASVDSTRFNVDTRLYPFVMRIVSYIQELTTSAEPAPFEVPTTPEEPRPQAPNVALRPDEPQEVVDNEGEEVDLDKQVLDFYEEMLALPRPVFPEQLSEEEALAVVGEVTSKLNEMGALTESPILSTVTGIETAVDVGAEDELEKLLSQLQQEIDDTAAQVMVRMNRENLPENITDEAMKSMARAVVIANMQYQLDFARLVVSNDNTSPGSQKMGIVKAVGDWLRGGAIGRPIIPPGEGGGGSGGDGGDGGGEGGGAGGSGGSPPDTRSAFWRALLLNGLWRFAPSPTPVQVPEEKTGAPTSDAPVSGTKPTTPGSTTKAPSDAIVDPNQVPGKGAYKPATSFVPTSGLEPCKDTQNGFYSFQMPHRFSSTPCTGASGTIEPTKLTTVPIKKADPAALPPESTSQKPISQTPPDVETTQTTPKPDFNPEPTPTRVPPPSETTPAPAKPKAPSGPTGPAAPVPVPAGVTGGSSGGLMYSLGQALGQALKGLPLLGGLLGGSSAGSDQSEQSSGQQSSAGGSEKTNSYPTAQISIAPNVVRPGEKTTVTWSSANASTCSIVAGDGALLAAGFGGTVETPALATSTIYTLQCSNGLGFVRSSAAVNVEGSSVVTPPPDETATGTPTAPQALISAIPTVIPYGGAPRIVWTSSGATECTVFGPDGSMMVSGLGGSFLGPRIGTTTRFSLSCANDYGTATSETTVRLEDSLIQLLPLGE